MYKLLRPLLFAIDPERVHHLVFSCLRLFAKIPGFKKIVQRHYRLKDPRLKRSFCGIHFDNPVGLAAGFDKNARLVDEMACFGFGFIEIGTLTPRPQPGNEKPRLFRLPEDQALINRMGFNNQGTGPAAERLSRKQSGVVIGGNIGRNKTTPNEEALNDYAHCLDELYPYVDYFVVNVSSPNTPGLRELQEKEPLRRLLLFVLDRMKQQPARKPVLLKIAPDLGNEQLEDIVDIVTSTGIDGIIATNTTVSRAGLTTDEKRVAALGAGGLSGRPLKKRAQAVTSFLRERLGKGVLIIGSGGIMTPQDAVERIKAGADLVQVYTGFVYEGPGLVKKINQALLDANI